MAAASRKVRRNGGNPLDLIAGEDSAEGREQMVAGCEPVAPHRRPHRRLHRCLHPATSPAVAAGTVRPSCSTGGGSGGGRWPGTGGADEAGADAGADEVGADAGGAVVAAAGTTPVGGAASTPVGGCWCSRRGSALGSLALRSAPDGADEERRMCTAADGVAPVRRQRRQPLPQSTTTATAAINSPGSKREPNFFGFNSKMNHFNVNSIFLRYEIGQFAAKIENNGRQ